MSNSPGFGGGEKFISEILVKANTDFELIAISERLIAKNDGLRTYKFNSSHFFKQLIQLKRTITQGDYDYILLNGGSSMYFAPFLWPHKVIIWKHTTKDSYKCFFRRLISNVLFELSGLFAKRIIHVSNYSHNQQIFSKNKARTIYHGVNVNKLPLCKVRHNPVRFLYVGRLEKEKGVDLIIDAFSQIDQHLAELWVVGDGPLWHSLKRAKNILYFGFQENVVQYYKQCDVFISLPVFEAFGITIIESMSFGLPVITCPVGGIPEIIINRFNGILVRRRNQDIVQAMKAFIHDEELYSETSRNSLVSVRGKFDIHRIIKIIDHEIENWH